MKRIFIIFFVLFSALLFSCSLGADDGGGTTQDGYVTLTNETPQNLEVYDDSLRNTLLATIPAGKSERIRANLAVGAEKVFYLIYHVDIGLDVPFYDGRSYIIFTSDGASAKSVSYPPSMDASSAYIALENNASDSGSQIELMRGSGPLLPSGKSSTLIEAGEHAIYEIKNPASTNLNYSSFKISVLGGGEMPLPTAISYFESGAIYTVSCNGSAASLLSKTAFDMSAKSKIWSRKSYGAALSSTRFITHVLRTRHDRANGSMAAGVLRSAGGETAKIILIDECGRTTSEGEIAIADSDKNAAQTYLFYDLMETSAGNFVALIQAKFSGDKSGIYFVCWDSSLKTCEWLYQVDQDAAKYLFTVNTKGKIAEIGRDTFALCGSRDNKPFIETLSYNAAGNTVTAKYFSADSAGSAANAENIFTSMIYDGSSFIVTGYTNFDGTYSPARHSGIVYKIDFNLTSAQKIYEKEKCLFYGIDLDSDGAYYICGEAADNGNALHGCLTSSRMIADGEAPRTFNGSKTHTLFTQLCVEENRITFSGATSADRSGSGGTALVMAVNKGGEEMWRSEFAGYGAVYSCMANGIGSFLIELYNADTRESKIVSTDLLGNDTGAELGAFGG